MRASPRFVTRVIVLLMVIMVAYWIFWYSHRSLVASENSAIYTNFENAFPLADGLLTGLMGLTAWSLTRRRSSAVLGGLAAGGAGLYLFGMDVLFDLEHGIWTRGAGGAIELVINLLTLAASAWITAWTWSRRRDLDPVAVADPRVDG